MASNKTFDMKGATLTNVDALIIGDSAGTRGISIGIDSAVGPSSVSLGYTAITTGSDSIAIGTSTNNTHNNSVCIGNGVGSRRDDEFSHRGVRIIRETRSTTTTASFELAGFSTNVDEVVISDLFLTERNTVDETTVCHIFRDFHVRNKSGVSSFDAGSTTTSNPDSAPASTVSTGFTANVFRLSVTPADTDAREWVAIQRIYCCDLA
jgi:hypothetical protein